jgi:DDE superfamily endonuclease
MGPQSARSYPGRRMVKPAGPEAQRAKQEIDYGRRGVAGHVFGAFQPAKGDALTAPYLGRTTANWVDFLGKVEAWIDPAVARVYAVMDNLNTHSATDVLLFALAHPRWEFVFQPKYAAYLNLIEPWWKIRRSLALKGRRFEIWARSKRPSGVLPSTGTRTSIPSSGGAGGGTAPRAASGSPPCQTSQ